MSAAPRPWKTTATVAALVALHVVLAMWSTLQRSVTVDEIFHVTGGYLYDKFGDFRIHPDNGVLPQRLHALPAVLGGAKPPPLEGSEYWRLSDVYVVSHQFFYESGNDHWPLLLAARAVNLLFSVGILLLVYAWARRLGGDVAGFVALGLGAFSPTLLAHGPLATTDAAAALTLTASAGAFWVQLRAPDWRATLGSALVFGLACVAKYSAVLLLPVFAILACIHFFNTPPAARRLRPLVVGAAVHAAMAFLIIWACFGFRYSAFAPGVPPAEHFIMSWDWMLDRAGWQGGVLRFVRDHRVLPEAFLFGYTHTYVGSLTRSAYLAGEFSDTGWRTFFPLAFLWKSTPVELAGVVLCAFTAGLRWRRLRPWLLAFAPLLVLTAVYGGVALRSHLNIGHRHLLPLYPALFIATGVAIARLGAAMRWRLALAAAAVTTQAATAALIFPHDLAYFNAFAGGPANGWRLLVDSSLDWGQELPALKTWLAENNSGPAAAPVFLSYFGSGEPAAYGVQARQLPFVNGFKTPHPYTRPEAGLYCVSATTLVQVYSPVRGPWTPALEEEYQKLRALEPLFDAYVHDARRRAELNRDAPEAQWQRTWARHDLLRFARLCHFLRVRRPDATIGYSMFVYRLNAHEISAATAGSLTDWRALIESAAAQPK